LNSADKKRLLAIVVSYVVLGAGAFAALAFGDLSESARLVVAIGLVVVTGIASYASARTYRR